MPNGKRFQNPWIMDFNRPVSIHQWMFWGAHELEKDVSVPLTQLQSLFLVDLHRWFFFTHGSCFVEDPSQLGSGHQVGQITDMCIHVCNVMQRNVVQCNMMPCNSQWNLKKCSKHLLENLGLAPLAPPPYKQEWDPHMAGIIPPTRTSAKSTNNILPGRRRPLKWTWHAAVIVCCDFGGDP